MIPARESRMVSAPGRRPRLAAFLLAGLSHFVGAPAFAADHVERVYFPSEDGKTELVGYLFSPGTAGPHPAMVLLHGRGGPYAAHVAAGCTYVRRDRPSACGADTLSARHLFWARQWVRRGFVALHVDSFGPRGKAHGFARHTHGSPERADVDEVTVRPLDAMGGLSFLLTRPEVDGSRIGVQGWSNGGSTVLNALPLLEARGGPQFHVAMAFYPGCGRAALRNEDYRSRTPLLLELAEADDQVSAHTCRRWAEAAMRKGNPVQWVWNAGATHGFDSPEGTRQKLPANRDATQAAVALSAEFVAKAAPRSP